MVIPQNILNFKYFYKVRQSRYMIQIIACTNRTCCDKVNVKTCDFLECFFSGQFLPQPAVLEHRGSSLKLAPPAVELKQGLHFTRLMHRAAIGLNKGPQDMYCPSMMDKLNEVICPVCSNLIY